ncbi:MAG: tetratricopeptide repeat protein [Streptosporangiaceae bacterium]
MVEPPAVPFAALLRQLRINSGLTQEELAVAASMSARSISDLERGVARNPRRETVRLLADALHLADADRAPFEKAARWRRPSGGFAAAAARALPRDVASFTGRERELLQLVDGVSRAAGPDGAAGIYSIGGMAGIGKTTLAVHAAHQLAERFPDGQVFLPLDGHTPGHLPVDPADALASLLQICGVAAGQIPERLEARTALWRDHLAGKQMLLLLDDASGHEQVRPLLPGTAGSLVLITSRRHLTALEDVQSVSLDIFSREEAAKLLVRLAGRPGLDPGDSAVEKITELCGWLPLAIGLLGRQLHHHPAWTAANLATELAAARERLGLMEAENQSVAAAFDLSYRDLAPEQQQLFRRLSLHPGTDIDRYAATALNGTDLTSARHHLNALYDHYLLAEPAHGRYRLHDLIREHARAKAATDPPSEGAAAIGRLVGYYLRTAAVTEGRLARQPQIRPAPARPSSAPIAVPDLADYAKALSWARTERANLLACLDHATRTGQHAQVVALSASMATLLRQDGPWTEAITRHTAAVHSAQCVGDQPGHANALSNLGNALYLTGDYRGAAKMLDAALDIYRHLGDLLGQGNALNLLGTVRYTTGDGPGATKALGAALDIYGDLGDLLGQANALNRLGAIRQETGNYPGAAEAQEQALDIYREIGHQLGQANALNHLGTTRSLTGDYPGAARAQEEALDIYRDLGDRLGQANALTDLGEVNRRTHIYEDAAQTLEAALDIYHDLGDRLGAADALTYLGAVRRETGDHQGAIETLDAALSTCRDLGNRWGQAKALNELGALHQVRNDIDQAETCHQQALDVARGSDSAWNEAHALAGLARCALATGRITEAKAIMRQAWEIFLRIGSVEATGAAAELEAFAKA